MLRGLCLSLSLVAVALAGCVTPPTDDMGAQNALLQGVLGAKEQLWLDPQNAPHPAYGWATLANPANATGLPSFWAPIPSATIPEHISGIAPLAETKDEVVKGGGIALFGSLAIVPGYGEPSKVVDISDPSDPAVLGELLSENNHRGAVVVPYPDGRLVTALSTGGGFEVYDITDPAVPVQLAIVETPRGGHKIGVVPGTPIIYNANSRGGEGASPVGMGDPNALTGNGAGATEIYDLTDPAAPLLVQEFPNGYGCHHIYFWVTEEKQRATCAGIEYSQIWDIADPLNPSVIVSIPVHHGVNPLPSYSTYLNFAHFAILNDDGTILIVGDETGGGSIAPGCDVRVDSPVPGPVNQVSGPLGNLYFYDVTDESSPMLQGWVGMSTLLPDQTSCTAHHGRLVPDPEGRDMLAMAFYGAGVALIDFSNPQSPAVMDSWADGSDTWEVWYYNGYLFTGDLNRGLDVLTLE